MILKLRKELPWTFDKNKAALLVIDMQNDFVKENAVMEVPMARRFLPNMKRILDNCRKNGIPAIYTQHVLYDQFEISPLEATYNPDLKESGMRAGTDGAKIIDALAPLPSEIVIPKHRYDAFHNTPLENIINNIRGMNEVDTLIIIGTVTNVCCESTARSAFNRDYKVIFIDDANGGFDETSQMATLNIIKKVYGVVMSTDNLIETIEKAPSVENLERVN